jgi:hypothetical protein
MLTAYYKATGATLYNKAAFILHDKRRQKVTNFFYTTYISQQRNNIWYAQILYYFHITSSEFMH